MKKPLVIANWKMYVESPQEAKAFVQGLKRKLSTINAEVWVAPPTPFISLLSPLLKNTSIKLGTQKVTHQVGPQHTGSISAAMLRAVGANFAIIGHSEYRAAAGTNEKVRGQFVAAVQAGLVPVLCAGELERREDGTHFAYIEEQLRSALRGAQLASLSRSGSIAGKLVVAYEPVWAIGKGAKQAITPETLEETIIFIRKTLADVLGRKAALKVPILYGGSVEGENAEALLREGVVGGFLVGHASATLSTFLDILRACQK